MWRIAQYLGHSGSYPAVRDLFQLIADAYAASDDYGPEHPETLGAHGNVATWESLTYWTGQADVAGARTGS